MPKYSTAFGMDVHLRSTTVCALDADTGEAVTRRFPGNPWGEIAGWMDGFPGPSLAAYESGYLGFAPQRELAGLGVECVVAAVSKIPRSAADSASKNDRNDAGLATLMWTVPGGARETGGPYMRDPRHPRHFTDDFKRQIVDLYNAGKPKREIMDEYDLGKSTVERWIKSINATGSPRAADNRTPEQNRILELERENRRLRMEVDVLKQAALIYARK